jgi:putative transposase
VKTRYQQIERLANEHPVVGLCHLLAVSRSGYYDWRGRGPSRRQREDARITRELQEAFEQSRQTYGRPRLTHCLRQQGHLLSQRRVGRLMREAGLCARRRRRYRPQTTQSCHDGPIAPNRLAERAVNASRCDEVWVTDMTYIRTGQGWLFLAVVLDLYSRRVVGWAFSESLATELPLAALRMALTHRKPAGGLLHHSDRGCQYASAEYRLLLADHEVIASMSRSGNPYDNAQMESFFSTFKTECINRYELATHQQAQAVAFDYLEAFYNRRRCHSALAYQSPVDFENKKL